MPGDDVPNIAGQCVNFVKYITGLSYSGNANAWTKHINTQTPSIGSVIVMQAGRFGHLGIVVAMDDNNITVRSRNWEGLWIISDNTFNTTDERIKGYIYY